MKIQLPTDKYVLFHGKEGIVHIIPDEKLKEMFDAHTVRLLEEVDRAIEGVLGDSDYKTHAVLEDIKSFITKQ